MSRPGPDDLEGTDPLSFSELTVERLLDRLSAREPAPGGGAVAAIAVAMAASLCAMAARYSEAVLAQAPRVVAEAEALRQLASRLADDDAAAYRAVLGAGRLPAGALRDTGLSSALSLATDVPVAVVRAAADVVHLAAEVAAGGNPNLRGDALTALLLAEGAARAAGTLVRINLASAGSPADSRLGVTESLLEEIAAEADRLSDVGAKGPSSAER